MRYYKKLHHKECKTIWKLIWHPKKAKISDIMALVFDRRSYDKKISSRYWFEGEYCSDSDTEEETTTSAKRAPSAVPISALVTPLPTSSSTSSSSSTPTSTSKQSRIRMMIQHIQAKRSITKGIRQR
mmetsp:Transcript_19443/g.26720  ORF Transcript_19443/g.26720 Transcript_19443/m.26720 type:complete len:127 (+) Transcript_19443:982-1362(+)